MTQETITPTIDLKKKQQEVIKEAKKNTQDTANKFLQGQKFVEGEFEKYYKELQKHTNLFVLTKTEKTANYDVKIYELDQYGDFDYTKGSSIIDVIEVKYNTCNIYIPKSSLPEGFPNVNLEIEEHTTHSRRGWRTTSHGYKMKFSLGWSDSKYYKTGRVIVKEINERIASLERQASIRRLQTEFENTVTEYMENKYGQENLVKHDSTTYTINLQNGISLYVVVSRDSNYIFKPENIKVQTVYLDNGKFPIDKAYECLKSI